MNPTFMFQFFVKWIMFSKFISKIEIIFAQGVEFGDHGSALLYLKYFLLIIQQGNMGVKAYLISLFEQRLFGQRSHFLSNSFFYCQKATFDILKIVFVYNVKISLHFYLGFALSIPIHLLLYI